MKYPLFKVHIDTDDVLPRLKDVLESGFVNEGREVTELKQLLMRRWDLKNVTMTSSCTASLMMALKIAGVDNTSEVIAPSMTCVATNVSTEWLGATTVWADINPYTGNIDPDDVKKKITDKTRAVICVDWAGIPCDLEKLQSICADNNVKLIQDAAHAFGSRYNGSDVCHWADITCYSFQAIKHITAGDGGAIVCLDDHDHELASRLKWYGFDRDRLKDNDGNWKGKRWDSNIIDVGWKMNMNNISAAICISNLAQEEKIVGTHKRNAKIYTMILGGNNKITPLYVEDHMDPAYWIYTVVLDESVDRDKVIAIMESRDIQTGVVHVPNHNYDCFDRTSVLPNTDIFSRNQICIPCGWWLSEKDVVHIANTLINSVKEAPRL